MENEVRLIDANAVIRKINAFAASVVYRGSDLMITGKDSCNPHEYTRGYEQGVLDAQKIVSGQVAVDAMEPAHARWVKPTPHSQEFCTNCRLTPKTNFGWLPPHCPNCGAKMDGDVDAKKN